MSDYGKIVLDQLRTLAKELQAQQEARRRIQKLRNLIVATFELMDEDEKALYSAELAKAATPEQSLTQAIRDVFRSAGKRYLTATEIRDQLANSGYDFTDYQSNPLVSVYSVLNRLSGELEEVRTEGTRAFRFRRTPNKASR